MAQRRMVYNDMDEDAPAPLTARLFDDICFWVAQRCPSRSTFVEHITNNGGRMTRLEKQADVLIADHLRDAPVGSLSYTWIEACLREGELVDKEEHLAGPRTQVARPVGSVSHPAKTHRMPYTAADDLELWNWVTECQRQGGKVLGNELYKQLEEKNNRHTWQSWRDRWVKRVSINPPAGAMRPRPPTPPPDVNGTTSVVGGYQNDRQRPAPQPRCRVRAASRELDIQSSSPVAVASSERPSAESPARQDRVAKTPKHGHKSHVTAPEPAVNNHTTTTREAARPGAAPSGTTNNTMGRAGSDRHELSTRQSSSPVQGQRRLASADDQKTITKTRPDNDLEDDYNFLYNSAPEIQNITVGNYDAFWNQVARFRPHHTAVEWKRFFEDRVLPVWKVKDSHNFRTSGNPSSSSKPDAEQVESSHRSSTPKRQINPAVVIESPISAERQARAAERDQQARVSPNTLKRKRGDVDERHQTKKRNTAKQMLAASTMSRSESAHSSQVEVVNLVDHEDEETDADSEGHPISRKDASSDPEAFKVYESRAVPEGEKENFTLDSEGMPTMPAPHKHVKTEEAFEAFGDPTHDFLLQRPPAQDVKDKGQAEEEPEEGSWHDVDDYRTEQKTPLDVAPDALKAAARAADEGPPLDTTAPDLADDESDPEVLDELRREYERHASVSRSRRSQSPLDDRDTQAILNGATQVPDFDVPLPSSDVNYEDVQGTLHYPRLPRMSQEDDEDDYYHTDPNGAQQAPVDQTPSEDEEGDFAFDAPDLEVPPPLGYEAESQDAVDGAEHGSQGYNAYLESQLGSQPIKAVHSIMVPPRSSRPQSSKHVSKIQQHQPPSSSPQPRSSQASSPAPTHRNRENAPGQPLNGTNHPTISTITVKQEPQRYQAQSEPDPALPSSPAPAHFYNVPPPPINRRLPPTAGAAFRPSRASVLSDAGTQTDDDRPVPTKPTVTAVRAPRNSTSNTTVSAPTTVKRPTASAPHSSTLPSKPHPTARFSTGTRTTLPTSQTIPTPLTTYISTRLSRGHSTPQILYALQQTNADFTLADFVLRSLEETGRVPNGVRGVWTDEDDEVLRGGDARKMRELEVLHGVKEFGERWEGLRRRGLL